MMLQHLLGLDNSNSVWYLFYSGIGSDLGELGLIYGLFKGFKKLHVQRIRQHHELITKLGERNG